MTLSSLAEAARKATAGEWTLIAPRRSGGALGDHGDCGIDANGVAIGEFWEHCPSRSNPDGVRVDAHANAAYIALLSPERVLAMCAVIEAAEEIHGAFKTPGSIMPMYRLTSALAALREREG